MYETTYSNVWRRICVLFNNTLRCLFAWAAVNRKDEETMALVPKQAAFLRKVALLILYIEQRGFHATFGDAYATSGHKDGSFHYKRMALDLNLFDKDYKYLSSTKDHEPFGEFWELLGGTWGGRFRKKDGNHYSYLEV